MQDRADYYIHRGIHIKGSIASEKEKQDENVLRCKNYGCNKFFKEEENSDTSCQHHTAPPIFHDTMKCWSCCKDRKAFDFESFQLIAGCSTGKHSVIAQKISIAASPNSQSDNVPAIPPAQLKSIAAYNNDNPNASSATSSALKTLVRKSSRKEDGTAKCQRKGC